MCCYGNHYVIAYPNERVNIGSGLQSNGSQLVLKGEKTLSHKVSGLPVSEQFTEHHEGNDLVIIPVTGLPVRPSYLAHSSPSVLPVAGRGRTDYLEQSTAT